MDKAEFDRFAEEYCSMHRSNIAITGEEPEFFHEYKVRDTAACMRKARRGVEHILDFGSGIGNSIPYFRKWFSGAQLTCADVSSSSIAVAQRRFPGPENFVQIDDDRLPLADRGFDLVFSACVFHHIPHEEHGLWLRELARVTRPGGALVIFEHNPWNPLTVHAVKTCPFDENARLMSARVLRERVLTNGWSEPGIRYRIFFPRALAFLRPLERMLWPVAAGAQYFVHATKH